MTHLSHQNTPRSSKAFSAVMGPAFETVTKQTISDHGATGAAKAMPTGGGQDATGAAKAMPIGRGHGATGAAKAMPMGGGQGATGAAKAMPIGGGQGVATTTETTSPVCGSGSNSTENSGPTVSLKLATKLTLSDLFTDYELLRMCMPAGTIAWTKRTLEVHARSGELVRPIPGMYARADYWKQLTRAEKMVHVARTAVNAHNGWTLSHTTAALLHGADVPRALLWPIHYTTTYSGGGGSAKHFCHHRAASIDKVKLDGVCVTSPAQTVVDCARTCDFISALAIADSFLNKKLVTKEELEAYLAQVAPHTRGIRQAQRVVSLADPRPMNGGESQVRALMIELGLPMPELQARVPDPEKPWRSYLVDFLFTLADGTRVAFELDGLEKYENIQMTRGKGAVGAMRDERQREAAITAYGIKVVRMGFEQAMQPDFLLLRLAVYGVEPVA